MHRRNNGGPSQDWAVDVKTYKTSRKKIEAPLDVVEAGAQAVA
jgi:hypothetical protein